MLRRFRCSSTARSHYKSWTWSNFPREIVPCSKKNHRNLIPRESNLSHCEIHSPVDIQCCLTCSQYFRKIQWQLYLTFKIRYILLVYSPVSTLLWFSFPFLSYISHHRCPFFSRHNLGFSSVRWEIQSLIKKCLTSNCILLLGKYTSIFLTHPLSFGINRWISFTFL